MAFRFCHHLFFFFIWLMKSTVFLHFLLFAIFQSIVQRLFPTTAFLVGFVLMFAFLYDFVFVAWQFLLLSAAFEFLVPNAKVNKCYDTFITPQSYILNMIRFIIRLSWFLFTHCLIMLLLSFLFLSNGMKRLGDECQTCCFQCLECVLPYFIRCKFLIEGTRNKPIECAFFLVPLTIPV